MPEQEHVHHTIRRIARMLTHDPSISDASIIAVARMQGCDISPVLDLNKLTFIENFTLGKHMVFQGQVAGISFAEMAGARPRAHN